VLTRNDRDSITREVMLFREAGGRTLVAVSPLPNPGRDPVALAEISRRTGVRIVLGVAYYLERGPAHSAWRTRAPRTSQPRTSPNSPRGSVTGIKPGIIGEVGGSWPSRANERKCLDAATVASIETGIPISIHPGFHVNAPPPDRRDPDGRRRRSCAHHPRPPRCRPATPCHRHAPDAGRHRLFPPVRPVRRPSQLLPGRCGRSSPPITIVWTGSRRWSKAATATES
jgi:hypothetical protein